MKNAKQEIKESVYLYIDGDSLISGSLKEISKKILNLEKKVKETYNVKKLKSYIRLELSLDTDYDGCHEFNLMGVRLETDDEYNTRMARSKSAKIAQRAAVKKRKENKEKEERKLYQKLQKKFG